MADVVPTNGVQQGPRSARWHPLEPATLLYAEALDKGDIRNKVAHRDRVMSLTAPFTGQPAELLKTEWRYGGLSFTAVSYTHLRAHETVLDLVCRLLLEKKKTDQQ